jgi:putative endonuclease
MNTRETGNQFESIAVEYLENLDYKIIERNFYSKFGEIDIIILKEDRISAIEVKYRKNPKVSIFETIPYSKIKKIEKTLYYYLTKNNYPDKYNLGIDALLIEDVDNEQKIHFIKDIQLNY